MIKRNTKNLASSLLLAGVLVTPNIIVSQLHAQQVDFKISNIADKELSRRQAQVVGSAELMNKGDELVAAARNTTVEEDKDKNYTEALKQYKAAYDTTPESDATDKYRKIALDKFSQTAVRLAEQKIKQGRYADAKEICKMVIEEGYNPNYTPALTMLARLEDPAYYNQTSGPQFLASVEEVKRLLEEAENLYDTGRYDLALKRTDQVLNIDKYNSAARRLQERINSHRSDNYGRDAYNEARSRRIWEVDKAWESPVPDYGFNQANPFEQAPQEGLGTAYINSKLNRIIIPRLEFKDATVREAIDFLKEKSRELDVTEPDVNRRGVNIVLKLTGSGGGATTDDGSLDAAPATSGGSADSRITLSLSNIPLGEALRYVAKLAELKVTTEEYAVAVVPLSEPEGHLITKTYRVPPGFIKSVPSGGSTSSGGLGSSSGSEATADRGGAKEFLESQGVEFPPGASAYYQPSNSSLIVRNRQDQIELVDTLVSGAIQAVPTQVEIESKFVEITQNNLKELGFDWLLGSKNLYKGKVSGSGGTSGTSPALNTDDYPYVYSNNASIPFGQNPVTSGLRTGSLAVSANAVDALLFGTEGVSSVAPGIFGVAGILSNTDFQMVIRALDQKKGVDLLSSPKVTTVSGQSATIEVIREFRYPTEFDPPQIPQTFGAVGGSGGSTITGSSSNIFPVTPTTPTTFETKNIGVTLNVRPEVDPDGGTIALELTPEVVEFEGFVNYGSPIQTVVQNAAGLGASSFVLTPNEINQPVFSTRRVQTNVVLWDGQTVSLGGLMREDVQKVDDKVPVLGDIPFIGRAFRSSVDQHIKRNLIIFVTASIINPAGQPISATNDEEEAVESTINPSDFNTALPVAPELPYFPK